ncbi:hypothetical protein BDV95DRAFT_153883 [Massariosphaeria phaeospora]|uniref:Uncharacterized protein n=1 Tax=Massariosphaeria phaeospora TaxID=100035 RepID=A0A7C8IIU0_9PLEO|nr:hypothetical protein BDV95DRAFT_153883 [Massariosphaeria phaeospora]
MAAYYQVICTNSHIVFLAAFPSSQRPRIRCIMNAVTPSESRNSLPVARHLTPSIPLQLLPFTPHAEDLHNLVGRGSLLATSQCIRLALCSMTLALASIVIGHRSTQYPPPSHFHQVLMTQPSYYASSSSFPACSFVRSRTASFNSPRLYVHRLVSTNQAA